VADEQWIDLASEEIVTLNLAAEDKFAAIDELAELLHRAGKLSSKEQFINDVQRRELEIPTSVGRGVAIPHARSSAVLETAVAVGRAKGIHWADDDEEPVRMVFLLAVPSTNPSTDYIGMLSALASALLEDDFCQGITAARTSNDIVECMRRYSVCAKSSGGNNVQ
jgi:fructose-specific phosphotransferase system IIA component